MVRFRQDLRLRFYFPEVEQSDKCDHKIYVRSKYQPSPGYFELKDVIDSFEQRVLIERNLIHARHTPSTNLTAIQSQILNHLQSQSSIDIIILMCNKNLGPAAM